MADPGKMRGLTPTPRHKLQASTPFRPVQGLIGAPTQFAVVPKQLSMWLNDTYGDCVTAEEAYAKAAFSVMNGLPELFIPDTEVQRWATKYDFLNGAVLTDVMDQMAIDGFTVNGVNYKDGPYQGVDYSNEAVLQAAISQGPVNIGIDANALPTGAGNANGWFSFGKGTFPNEDHCVSLTGYGTAGFCFGALGLPVPHNVSSDEPSCYLLFTWDTIGVVNHDWLMGTCAEAWIRLPTTPGQGPTPPPPPVPVPPSPPAPPSPPVPPVPPGPMVISGKINPLDWTFTGTTASANTDALKTDLKKVLADMGE